MPFYISSYVTTLYLSTIFCAAACVMSWKRRPAFGSVPLSMLLGGIAFWSFLQAYIFMVHDLETKMFLANFRYIGIELIPLSYIALAYEHTKKKHFFNAKRVLAVLSLPIIFFIILLTDRYHHLFYSDIRIDGYTLVLDAGIGFWLNIFYIYFFLALGIILFITSLPKASKSHRVQTMTFLLSSVIPFGVNMLFNFNILPSKNLDLTPLAFGITGLICFYGLYRVVLFNIIPIARDELFENLNDGVIVLDNKKQIVDMNKQALKFFYFVKETGTLLDFIGKTAREAFHFTNNFSEMLYKSENLNEAIHLEHGIESRYFHVSKKSIYNKKGQCTGELVVLRDTTELEKALLEAKAAQKAAEQASYAKSRFLANMSHEIRTPMNAIIGIADILHSTEMPPDEQKKNLKILMNSAEGLLEILNDILDYSKIEAGKLELESTGFDLKELLEETINTFEAQALKKKLYLNTRIDGHIPPFLLGDPVRLKQILSNLISNALKFTPSGGVQVSARSTETTDNTADIYFTVSDTGIGIPGEMTGSLFESFKQLDSSTTRKYGGTGLGLAIVKNLIEMMGGSIHVESNSSNGSSFCFNIPFPIAREAAKKTVRNTEIKIARGNSTLSIIVAEDNKVNQDILKILLGKKGVKADFADNGKILLDMLENKAYNLIFMDMQMPEMDGLEAAAEIRKKEKESGKHTIIIALTANAMKGDREQCINAGMDDYLSKPVRFNELSDMIDKYFS